MFKKNENEKKYIDLEKVNAELTNVRRFKNGAVSFTLKCDGFSFYNLTIRETKDGKHFISIPSTKGKDDNYYNQYGLYLSKSDEANIIDTVSHMVED